MNYNYIKDIINADIGKIYKEQGYQDGMYPAQYGEEDGLHRGDSMIERIIREPDSNHPIRIYVLNVSLGGICIMSYSQNTYKRKESNYAIFQLGEDDGFFFLTENSFNYLNKLDFIELMSRGISLLNNIK